MKRYLILGMALVILAVAALCIPDLTADDDFAVTFIDVGQGDSILISYDGYYALVDGGGSQANVTDRGEYVVVPYLKALGVTKLDYVFNTHPDADHIGGLFAVLDQLAVDNLVVYEKYDDVYLSEQLLSMAEYKAIPVNRTAAGAEFSLGDQVEIKVLSPPSGRSYDEDTANEGSLVLYVSYKDLAVLLTGDLQGEELMEMYSENRITRSEADEVDIVQLPHHGSFNSIDLFFYYMFMPDAVVASVGKDNAYGHPSWYITAFWEHFMDVPVLRTDMDGNIRISHDGESHKIEVFAE